MDEGAVLHRPPPPLRPYVSSVVGYALTAPPGAVHRGLPSPALTIVLPLDAPLVVAAHADPGRAPGAYDGLVGGLHVRPALIVVAGRQAGVQLGLTPLGARALLGLPAAALASCDAELDDVLGAAGRELLDRVRAAPSWPARFVALDAVLLRVARQDAALAPEVAEAWRLLTAGARRVDGVARAVGWSARHLSERFAAETGLTPKQAQRVVRFDRARRLLTTRAAAGAPLRLADVAADAGFADQAHLTREWTALAGLPPRRWAAEELAYVQDGTPATATGSGP